MKLQYITSVLIISILILNVSAAPTSIGRFVQSPVVQNLFDWLALLTADITYYLNYLTLSAYCDWYVSKQFSTYAKKDIVRLCMRSIKLEMEKNFGYY
ncbi:UNKNOWN [Stylonychia lemnae]|uniref:Uncharacterized protein n=1 Tax=Stylonychia lemnae TaxID=5949 RepID=A0A078AU77_STYLE|nr:UNKNOWN [Stylonychia lemnae]|eukprot:CDW85799.1 UNKNOWN [Stylonychia lemnae]